MRRQHMVSNRSAEVAKRLYLKVMWRQYMVSNRSVEVVKRPYSKAMRRVWGTVKEGDNDKELIFRHPAKGY